MVCPYCCPTDISDESYSVTIDMMKKSKEEGLNEMTFYLDFDWTARSTKALWDLISRLHEDGYSTTIVTDRIISVAFPE